MFLNLNILIDCAKFVDITGNLKPSGIQASQLHFDRKAESMGNH